MKSILTNTVQSWFGDTSKLAMDFSDEHGTDVLQCPAQSQDPNPIERIWDMIHREDLGITHKIYFSSHGKAIRYRQLNF